MHIPSKFRKKFTGHAVVKNLFSFPIDRFKRLVDNFIKEIEK